MSFCSCRSFSCKAIASCRNFLRSSAVYLSFCTDLSRNSAISLLRCALLTTYCRSASSKLSIDVTKSCAAFAESEKPERKFAKASAALPSQPTTVSRALLMPSIIGWKVAANLAKAVPASSFFFTASLNFPSTAITAAIAAAIHPRGVASSVLANDFIAGIAPLFTVSESPCIPFAAPARPPLLKSASTFPMLPTCPSRPFKASS